MAISENFWKNKSVIITGAHGFVGKHLTERLFSLGALVVPLSRSAGNPIDVTDRASLTPFFEKKPGVVFHLAGESLVEKGQDVPYDTFQTNFIGTLNVLELSRLFHIPRVIIASTAHVYGVGTPPFSEDDPPRPSRPYETSKTITDLLAQSYADSFDLGVVIGRFANIYGPGDTNVTRLIPKTLRYALQKKPVPMWGGTAKREYLYIDDAVAAYLMLGAMPAVKLERNRIFNFGAGNPIDARGIIEAIGGLIGEKITIVPADYERKNEITDQFVLWEKASRILGWKPGMDLREGLTRTIEWHKNNTIVS
ncbi:MAG: NAD(P)-dependent oxidoreductase [Candidatus Gottesmanbacteria bacterium]|nr:NAD(P)-dependent oxidoreductase [Candidatus Gottesmanbacteria bacterium]